MAAVTVTTPAAAVDVLRTSGPRAQGDRSAVAVVVVVVRVVVLAVALHGVQTAEVPRAAVAIVAATVLRVEVLPAGVLAVVLHGAAARHAGVLVALLLIAGVSVRNAVAAPRAALAAARHHDDLPRGAAVLRDAI